MSGTAESGFATALADILRTRGDIAAAKRARSFSWGMRDASGDGITCARDQFGVRPLYYCHRPGRYFAFASEVEPLLALPGMERRLNRFKTALYLSSLAWDGFDTEMTFFEGIHRLPPGHLLRATPTEVKVQRYLRFEADPGLESMNEEELAEELRARLRKVIRRQRVDAGLLLSGGLKSSALAALASEDLPAGATLPCWAFVPVDAPGWQWPDDPRAPLAAMSAAHRLTVHPLSWDGWGMRDDDDCYPEVKQQPIWFHIREEEMTAMADARAAGLRALMSGVGGAMLPIFRRPVGVAAEALARGNWRDLLFDATGGRRRSVRELARLLKNDVVLPAMPACARRGGGAWIGRLLPVMRFQSMLRESVLGETGVADWVEARAARLSRDFRENVFVDVTRGALQQRLESWALLGAQHGLEMRYPFLEPEVAEFCLGLAPAYFLRGDPQRVLRRALQGLVPDTIRLRGRRLASVTDWPLRKVRKHPRERDRLRQLEQNAVLREFVDLTPMHAALDQFPSEQKLQGVVAQQGLVGAAQLVSPGGVPTTTEYFRGFVRFLERNGFC